MNPAMLAMAMQFLQSPEGQKLASSIPGLSGLTGMIPGAPAPDAQAQLTVSGALQLLADHMPADPTEYIAAINQALLGLAAIRLLAAKNAVAPDPAPAGGLSSIPLLGGLLKNLPGLK